MKHGERWLRSTTALVFTMKFGILINLVIFLSLLGCRCREDDRRIASLDDYQENETLAIINGDRYTKGDYDLEYALRMELLKGRIERMPAQKASQLKKTYKEGILGSFIENRLSDQYFKKSGIVPTHEVTTNVEAQFVRTFKSCIDDSKSPGAYDRLVASITQPKLKDLFIKNVAHAARVEAFLLETPSNSIVVTDAYLDQLEQRMRREDEDAIATNKVIYALATNIWQRASQGADFAALADKYSEEPGKSSGGVLGECDANDFAIEKDENGENPVWAVVGALRPGEVSPPISTADGLAVFKCSARVEKSENTDRPAIVLSRIVLHRALLYPPHTREELRTAISKERRQKALKQLSLKLREDARISFPHGTAFLPPRIRRAYAQLESPQNATNVVVTAAGKGD